MLGKVESIHAQCRDIMQAWWQTFAWIVMWEELIEDGEPPSSGWLA